MRQPYPREIVEHIKERYPDEFRMYDPVNFSGAPADILDSEEAQRCKRWVEALYDEEDIREVAIERMLEQGMSPDERTAFVRGMHDDPSFDVEYDGWDMQYSIGYYDNSEVEIIQHFWGEPIEIEPPNFDAVDRFFDAVLEAKEKVNTREYPLIKDVQFNSISLRNAVAEVYVCITFRFPEVAKKVGGTHYLIGSSDCVVMYEFAPRGLTFRGVEINRINSNRINPHVRQGQGGSPCLGGFDYPVNVSFDELDFESGLYSILEYNRTVDWRDEWGRSIFDYPVLTKVYRENRYISGDVDPDSITHLDVGNALTEYIIYMGMAYPKDKYYTSTATGKPIRIEDAVRVPVYISPKELETMNNAEFDHFLRVHVKDRGAKYRMLKQRQQLQDATARKRANKDFDELEKQATHDHYGLTA